MIVVDISLRFCVQQSTTTSRLFHLTSGYYDTPHVVVVHIWFIIVFFAVQCCEVATCSGLNKVIDIIWLVCYIICMMMSSDVLLFLPPPH